MVTIQYLCWFSLHITSCHGNLVGCWFWHISLIVIDSILVSLEEFLLVGLCVNHLWSIILKLIDAAWSDISVFRANLVVQVVKIASHASISDWLVYLAKRLVSLTDFFSKICDDFVKSWGTSCLNILLSCEDIVGSWQFRHLVLNAGEHITDCEIDSSSKLILVINKQPFC